MAKGWNDERIAKLNKRLRKLRKWADRRDDPRREEARRRLALLRRDGCKLKCCNKKRPCADCPRRHAEVVLASMTETTRV